MFSGILKPNANLHKIHSPMRRHNCYFCAGLLPRKPVKHSKFQVSEALRQQCVTKQARQKQISVLCFHLSMRWCFATDTGYFNFILFFAKMQLFKITLLAGWKIRLILQEGMDFQRFVCSFVQSRQISEGWAQSIVVMCGAKWSKQWWNEGLGGAGKAKMTTQCTLP